MQLIIAALVVVSLTAWGFFERSGRLSCKVENVKLSAQVDTLSDKIKEQNDAVDGLKAASVKAGKESLAALKRADDLDKSLDSTKKKLRELSKQPTPKGAGCEDAWLKIEEVSGHKKK